MKSFFRKLPDPLVTSELYGALIEASKTEPEQVRFNSIKRLVDELPEPHYSTLRYLASHLSSVAGKSNVNQMTAHNLAIVFKFDSKFLKRSSTTVTFFSLPIRIK